MQLSVIIVSYNAVDFLRKCLTSVIANLPENGEIIVWDNDSPDRSIELLPKEFPKVHFELHDQNLGFAKANNLAVSKAQSKYILILNPDTIIYESFFSTLFEFANTHTNIGAIGVRMIDGDGNFLPESKRNIPTAINSFTKLFGGITSRKGYYNTTLNDKENGPVEVLTGACMFMKKSTYLEVGGFDESYFMYGEDIDLSYTLLKQGYQNYYMGEIFITHFKGESTVKDAIYLERFYGAMEIFITKYYKQNKPLQYKVMLLGLKVRHRLEKLRLRIT